MQFMSTSRTHTVSRTMHFSSGSSSEPCLPAAATNHIVWRALPNACIFQAHTTPCRVAASFFSPRPRMHSGFCLQLALCVYSFKTNSQDSIQSMDKYNMI